MGRKTFYTIIAVGLSAIFIYIILCIFILKDLGLQTIQTARLKDLIVIAIIIYETIYATKTFRTYYLLSFPVAIIGYFFSVMHWPGGPKIFYSAITIIIISLIIDALRGDVYRLDKIIVLIYPVLRFTFMTTSIYRLPTFWWNIDVITLGLTAAFLLTRLAGGKLNAPHNT